MPRYCRMSLARLSACLVLLAGVLLSQQEANSPGTLRSDAEREVFLRNGKVIKARGVSTGINNTLRVTLEDGGITHDASFNDVDIAKMSFQTADGTELNFKDSYKFNIAAYKLDRLIGLNMVPVYVERSVNGKRGSASWFVDDVQMMEKDRFQKKKAPPDQERWNDQMYQVRVFNELVYNVDPNLGNLLITKEWGLVMIDFTRAFRLHKTLRSPKNLVRVDRRVYEGMKKLNQDDLQRAIGQYANNPEIQGLLARRDKIVGFFDKEIAAKGEAAVMCTAPGH